jgi:hypothetical protein
LQKGFNTRNLKTLTVFTDLIHIPAFMYAMWMNPVIGWKDEKNQQHIYHTAQNGERDKMGRKYAKPVRSRQACMRISFTKWK